MSFYWKTCIKCFRHFTDSESYATHNCFCRKDESVDKPVKKIDDGTTDIQIPEPNENNVSDELETDDEKQSASVSNLQNTRRGRPSKYSK
jgi:hypothetical protein